jgi:hypothetical protein
MPFTTILLTNLHFDQSILDQRSKNTVQRLFGNTQDMQQIIHRRPRHTIYKVDGAMVGATVPMFVQNAIWIGGKATIGEKHRFDPLTQLLVS